MKNNKQKCSCKNIIPQSKKSYKQMIIIDIPTHMSKYKESRIKNGLSDKVSIDPCIIEEIKELWNKGIITYGSCCGHNLYESFVNVDESNIEQMLSMGYVMNHKDKSRKDTFRLKMIN